MHDDSKLVKIGITIGDTNGIGMELIAKTLSDNDFLHMAHPIIYGSAKVASYYRKVLQMEGFNYLTVNSADESKPKKANLINCWEEEIELTLGKATADGGKYALKSLETAVDDLTSRKFDVLVTSPIDKHTINLNNFDFPGHTEYLANLSNVDEVVMLMVHNDLRVGVVTGHIPLKDVASTITTEMIVSKVKLIHNTLIKDFGIRKPKIAILGLNPHAGDKGLLGEEDSKVIKPAVKQLFDDGMLAYGPYAADGFFGSSNFKNFDAVLAMYHDQGLVPFKALSGGEGVNYTAGLPIIRTSPAHGTAYELVGKNEASPASFRNAMYLAVDIYKAREMYKELNANPLNAQKVVSQ